MSKALGPNDFQCLMNEKTKVHVMANTMAICLERKATDQEMQAAAAASEQMDRDVQGNRAGSAQMTWHDCRLMLAAHLRYCLKMLEDKGA